MKDSFGGLAVDHDHVLELGQARARLEHHRQVGLFDDRHLGGRIAAEVADLLSRIGEVDREWRGPQGGRGEVGEVEVEAVAEHQRHAVAAPHAKRGQPAGQRIDALQKLRPADHDGVVDRAHSGDVGVVRGRAAERLGHRGGVYGAPRRRSGRPHLHAVLDLSLGACRAGARRLRIAAAGGRFRGRQWVGKPEPDRVEMSLLRPITNTTMMSTKPTTPARSMTSKGIRRRRIFSARAQNTWPPSRGRNGNRLMTASDSEMMASVHSAWAVLKANCCWVTLKAPTTLFSWWRTLGSK